MRAAYYSRAGSYSRSYNACEAERAGRMPTTRASRAWGFRSAAALRRWVRTNEWHHVGKYANAVNYYDVERWLNDLCDEASPFAALAGLSKDMYRPGLRRVVRHIITSRMQVDPVPQCTGVNRKLKHVRRRELADLHGVSFDSASGNDLSDAGAVRFAAAALARKKQLQLEQNRKMFVLRMRKQMQHVSPRMDDHVRDKRWRDRFDTVMRQHGHTFASRLVRRVMRKEKMPLTLHNYRQAFRQFRHS